MKLALIARSCGARIPHPAGFPVEKPCLSNRYLKTASYFLPFKQAQSIPVGRRFRKAKPNRSYPEWLFFIFFKKKG